MPRKNGLSSNAQAIRKARNSGNRAALYGYNLKSDKDLKKINGYSEEQATAYIKAYNEQKLRQARTEGEHAANNSNELLSKERLIKEKNYSEAQALAYIQAYQTIQKRKLEIAAQLYSLGEDVNELLGVPSTDVDSTTSGQLVETEYVVDPKVKYAATKAAKRGCRRPTFEELKLKGNYNSAEANFYLDTYNRVAANTPDLALRKVRAAAQNEASRGNVCPLLETLEKKYSPDEIKLYLEAFNQAAKNIEPPHLRKARRAGQQAAGHGVALLSKEELKNERNYGDDEADAYIEGYQKSAPNLDEQVLIKARQRGQSAALSGRKKLSAAELNSQGYTDQQISAYSAAYDRSAGDATVQNFRRIRSAGLQAGRITKLNRRKLLSVETLRKRKGYTDDEAQVYIQAFHDSMAKKLQSALNVHPISEELIAGIEDVVTENGEDKIAETEQYISQSIVSCEKDSVNVDPYSYLEKLLSNPSVEMIKTNEEENNPIQDHNTLTWLEKSISENNYITAMQSPLADCPVTNQCRRR